MMESTPIKSGLKIELLFELIISFSLFLDGRNLGWRLSLLRALIGVTTIVATYVEEYIGVILLVYCAVDHHLLLGKTPL